MQRKTGTLAPSGTTKDKREPLFSFPFPALVDVEFMNWI